MVFVLVLLPLGVDARLVRGGEANPVFDVLWLLSLSVGLPFLVVSATAPLLQKWFTATGHPASRDPYFLYAASNVGSMLALLGYPALVEPHLRLRGEHWLAQTRLWTLGYVALVGLVALCAVVLWRSPRPVPGHDAPDADAAIAGAAGASPTTRERLTWTALAFAPSSLLLGVTTYITTDLAAVPLLWVIPLAIYLFTFILAFGRWPALLQRGIAALALPAVLTVIFLMVSGFYLRAWVSVLWHLGLLLVVALACHGKLARARPPSARLTEYYLLIALGGVLGGCFNAIVAPLVFNSLAEYPLAMAIACALIAAGGAHRRRRTLVIALPLLAIALALVTYSEAVRVVLARTPEALGRLPEDERWRPALSADPNVGVWRDDFHNLLSVFKW